MNYVAEKMIPIPSLPFYFNGGGGGEAGGEAENFFLKK